MPRASSSLSKSAVTAPFLQAASTLRLSRALSDSYTLLREAGVKPSADIFPDSPSDLWSWYGQIGAGRGLQRLLVAEVEDSRASQLMQNAQGDLLSVARLTGAQSKLAGTWLTTLPEGSHSHRQSLQDGCAPPPGPCTPG